MQSHVISNNARQMWLTQLTCFAGLTSPERAELSSVMIEEEYEAMDPIVVEGETVDSVFIIVTGRAEVVSSLRKTKPSKPLAILGPGEAIGLNDTGFFSATGLRTATVIAATDCLLLKIELETLHSFLKKYPHLQFEMHAATEQLSRLEFIKQILPFDVLTPRRLHWLSDQVKVTKFACDQTIFYQGEPSIGCYYLNSGKILVGDKEISTSIIFSEPTLVIHDAHQTTVRTVEPSEILFLKYELLTEFSETAQNIAAFSHRVLLSHNQNIEVHKNLTVDKRTIYLLKNNANGKYVKLSQLAWNLWQAIDGSKTLHDIIPKFAPHILEKDCAAIVSKLTREGFLTAKRKKLLGIF